MMSWLAPRKKIKALVLVFVDIVADRSLLIPCSNGSDKLTIKRMKEISEIKVALQGVFNMVWG